MHEELKESVFEAILKKAFCDYNEKLLASLPSCEELSKIHPLPKKEKRFFDRLSKEVKYGKSLVLVYLSRAAVIFLCFVTLAAAAMLSSPTVRASVKNVYMKWFEKYTLFTFVSTEPEENDFQNVKDVTVGYIPDGYELVIEDDLPGIMEYIYYPENDHNSDAYVSINIFENETTDLFPDNEHSEYSKMTINGHESWLIYNEANVGGTVIIVGAKISIVVYANLPKEELIKIAENIK